MNRFDLSPRERLVHHVQELEQLEAVKSAAADNLKTAFERAGAEGYDRTTLKVVLKLRKMTPGQRRERRALEAIYMAALGMLEGDALPDEARRRLDEGSREPRDAAQPSTQPPSTPDEAAPDSDRQPRPPSLSEQPPLTLKDPEEARQEGAAASAEGKRIYDNPYPAGDPCRAAWDEGWCTKQRSHGMETPAAFQRRSATPAKKEEDKQDKGSGGAGDVEEGAA